MIGAGRLSSLESMLAGDHDRLDRAFAAIVTRAHGGDYQQLEAEWLTFQDALLGVDLDLHCLSAERVETFVDALRAHAHREEHIFYPWVDKQLGG